MGKRKAFLVVSVILVVLSLAGAIFIQPKFGIDFMGGTEIQVEFKKQVSSAEIRQTLVDLGHEGADVVTFGQSDLGYLIKLQPVAELSKEEAAAKKKSFQDDFDGVEVSKFDISPGGDKLTVRLSKEQDIKKVEEAAAKVGFNLDTETVVTEENQESDRRCESVSCTWAYQGLHIYEVGLKGISDQVMEGLRAKPFGAGAERLRAEWVGPKVGEQLRDNGLASIGFALVFIMLYIVIRFDFRFAPGAVAALIHDVIITVGVFTLFRVEVTLATVAALLTIVGYSLNDTIVIFDRIRENLDVIKEKKLSQVINVSVNQTLNRTLLTSITTLLVVVSILSIGWKTTIRDFALALLIGVLVGTYSSIFVASPIVVWLDKKFGTKKA